MSQIIDESAALAIGARPEDPFELLLVELAARSALPDAGRDTLQEVEVGEITVRTTRNTSGFNRSRVSHLPDLPRSHQTERATNTIIQDGWLWVR